MIIYIYIYIYIQSGTPNKQESTEAKSKAGGYFGDSYKVPVYTLCLLPWPNHRRGFLRVHHLEISSTVPVLWVLSKKRGNARLKICCWMIIFDATIFILGHIYPYFQTHPQFPRIYSGQRSCNKQILELSLVHMLQYLLTTGVFVLAQLRPFLICLLLASGKYNKQISLCLD